MLHNLRSHHAHVVLRSASLPEVQPPVDGHFPSLLAVVRAATAFLRRLLLLLQRQGVVVVLLDGHLFVGCGELQLDSTEV